MWPDPAALEASALARVIATTGGVYPVLSALHIFGISLLVGPVLIMDLRLLRVFGPAIDPATGMLRRVAVAGFLLAATTGALLALVDLVAYLGNNAFILKLFLLVLALFNAVLFVRFGRFAPLAAALSLGLWVSVLFAGRFIAFVG